MSVDHRAMTEYRLEKSRRIIERQRELVAKRRSAGQPTAHSESVLATFERSHAALERSLVWIVQEEGAASARGTRRDDPVVAPARGPSIMSVRLPASSNCWTSPRPAGRTT
jgi:hypothetical protein